MVPMDINIGFQGFALIQGQINLQFTTLHLGEYFWVTFSIRIVAMQIQVVGGLQVFTPEAEVFEGSFRSHFLDDDAKIQHE